MPELKSLPQQYRTGTIAIRKRDAADGAKLNKRAADDGDGPDAESPAEDADEFEIAISSEAEISRWWGIEILSHDKGAVDMTRLKRGAAVLVDHWGDQVGVVESARVDSDKVLRGTIRMSRSVRGQEVAQDIRDGIRQNVSVGYMIDAMVLTEQRDGVNVYTATRWTPAEVSIVSVPADTSVGVGRSQGAGREFPVIIESAKDGVAVREEASMAKMAEESSAATPVNAEGERSAVNVGDSGEARRSADIRAICEANGLAERAGDFIGSTLSVEQISARVLEAKRTVGKAQGAEEHIRAAAGRDLREYSYLRAMRGALAMAEGKGKFEGLEREVHDELERVLPDGFQRNGGVLTPLSTRTTLTSVDTSKGVEIVPEQFGSLIELLRPRARVIESGATVMTGLSGPIDFPRQTGAATVFWAPENPGSNVADGEPSLGLATMKGKTLQGNIPFTRQLLMQASMDVEAWVRNELAIGHGLAVDKGAIHGRGNNGEPTGVYAAANVNSVDFQSTVANVTTPNLLSMISGVFDKNAQDNTMRWLTTPLMAAILRGTLEFSAASALPLWQGKLSDGTLLGYGAASTTQCSKVMSQSQPTGGSSHACVFGNWADLIVALFGAMELVVDPYTNKKKAIVEVTSFQMGDILVRHGESFSKAVNMTIT